MQRSELLHGQLQRVVYADSYECSSRVAHLSRIALCECERNVTAQYADNVDIVHDKGSRKRGHLPSKSESKTAKGHALKSQPVGQQAWVAVGGGARQGTRRAWRNEESW